MVLRTHAINPCHARGPKSINTHTITTIITIRTIYIKYLERGSDGCE